MNASSSAVAVARFERALGEASGTDELAETVEFTGGKFSSVSAVAGVAAAVAERAVRSGETFIKVE